MRLPDSFLDDLRARLSLSQVASRRVTWDMRKTNQARGDWWAPCPFHQEKTASFHVDDQKGFYYCFGCQAKGNVFGFVQETENVGFMEAVEILAAEAGMPMPARDPKSAERSDLRTRLAAVTEAAARWFRAQLATRAGVAARAYLEGRGLARGTLERFEIGYAPGRGTLIAALRERGIAQDLIEGAGLAYPARDGRPAGEVFRDRIVFPIRDARGRCLGFGGRAMDPGEKAKYLNSPETPLFDKGATLYDLGPARALAGRGAPLVVAEGYMDVIALAQAEVAAAVAPLGTAVTERQLRLLWRASPEPIVALDGDAAGRRAGLRLAELALPLIEAGQSLRFATLPAGRDPDDVIRDGGPDGDACGDRRGRADDRAPVARPDRGPDLRQPRAARRARPRPARDAGPHRRPRPAPALRAGSRAASHGALRLARRARPGARAAPAPPARARRAPPAPRAPPTSRRARSIPTRCSSRSRSRA